MLLGVNVAVVIFAVVLSVMLTVPETALLELSTKEKVLLVIVELSINSLKVAEMLEPFAPSDGEVEETVGAVVSMTNELIFNVTLLLALSVTVHCAI